MSEAGALIDEVTSTGEWVGGAELADAATAQTIRVRDGVPTITDGPLGTAPEQLAGYCIIDCAAAERAAEIGLEHWGVELRGVVGGG